MMVICTQLLQEFRVEGVKPDNLNDIVTFSGERGGGFKTGGGQVKLYLFRKKTRRGGGGVVAGVSHAEGVGVAQTGLGTFKSRILRFYLQEKES